MFRDPHILDRYEKPHLDLKHKFCVPLAVFDCCNINACIFSFRTYKRQRRETIRCFNKTMILDVCLKRYRF